MRMGLLACAGVALGLVLAGPAGAAAPGAGSAVSPPVPNGAACDEACLAGYVDRYLAGMIGHLPNHAPLAPGVRYTENAVCLPLGQGLWKTLSAVGTYRHIVADPSTGSVALFGTLEEAGAPGLWLLRLKVVNGRITEAEHLVPRIANLGLLAGKEAAVKPAWGQVLPPIERASRQQMIAIANGYFDGLTKGDANAAAVDPLCSRMDNGVLTVNDPAAKTPLDPARPGFVLGTLNCRDQIASRVSTHIQQVSPRRIYIVDEAKGVVFGMFHLRVPGTITEVDAPGVGRIKLPANNTRPYDVEVGQAFKIRNGRIVEMEAVSMTLLYGKDSGW